MDMQNALFSYNGRINRLNFFAYSVLLFIVNIFISLILFFLLLGKGAMFIYAIINIAFIRISFALTVKRLHDLDKTGWMSLLMFIPLLNLFMLIYLLFFKGTSGKNRFGEDPLGGTSQEANINQASEDNSPEL